jgi:hypothetical protein
MTRSRADFDLVHALAATGQTVGAIVRETGVPRSTVRDWLTGGRKAGAQSTACWRCDPDLPVPEAAYVHLLGAYLGDGCIVRLRRDVFRLVLVQDARYDRLIDAWRQSTESVLPNRCGTVRRQGCVALQSHSKHWPCLFPQHGPGPKHQRRIALEAWQAALVAAHPAEFVRGLVESDGCRFINRVVVRSKTYEYVRYSFTNESDDIRRLFCHGCELLGVRWTRMNRKTIAVSRSADVRILDSFIGPKS